MSSLPEDNGFIGESVVFREMLSILARVARYDTTVLISGETGSGKEMAARAVHYQGQRRDRPFIPVNCGALPDQLVENELFGHARGAYTDARESQLGLIAQAEGGTLFLDEVDTLTAKAQVSLLRFLQDGQYRRLGSSVVEKADVRVVAACNSDLVAGDRTGRVSRRPLLSARGHGTARTAAARTRAGRRTAGAARHCRSRPPIPPGGQGTARRHRSVAALATPGREMFASCRIVSSASSCSVRSRTDPGRRNSA
jgi:hypothetical protein